MIAARSAHGKRVSREVFAFVVDFPFIRQILLWGNETLGCGRHPFLQFYDFARFRMSFTSPHIGDILITLTIQAFVSANNRGLFLA